MAGICQRAQGRGAGSSEPHKPGTQVKPRAALTRQTHLEPKVNQNWTTCSLRVSWLGIGVCVCVWCEQKAPPPPRHRNRVRGWGMGWGVGGRGHGRLGYVWPLVGFHPLILRALPSSPATCRTARLVSQGTERWRPHVAAPALPDPLGSNPSSPKGLLCCLQNSYSACTCSLWRGEGGAEAWMGHVGVGNRQQQPSRKVCRRGASHGVPPAQLFAPQSSPCPGALSSCGKPSWAWLAPAAGRLCAARHVLSRMRALPEAALSQPGFARSRELQEPAPLRQRWGVGRAAARPPVPQLPLRQAGACRQGQRWAPVSDVPVGQEGVMTSQV